MPHSAPWLKVVASSKSMGMPRKIPYQTVCWLLAFSQSKTAHFDQRSQNKPPIERTANRAYRDRRIPAEIGGRAAADGPVDALGRKGDACDIDADASVVKGTATIESITDVPRASVRIPRSSLHRGFRAIDSSGSSILRAACLLPCS